MRGGGRDGEPRTLGQQRLHVGCAQVPLEVADRPPQPGINTSCCWFQTDTLWKDARWADDSDTFYFTEGESFRRDDQLKDFLNRPPC